jgi:DNA-binding NarL/FixJ family response regulator
MGNQVIRVLVVDDHTILRDALATFFETCDDLLLVGQAGDGLQAIAACNELQPDIVLMDLLMPVMDGVTATRAICQQHPHIKILILTSLADQVQVQEALTAGASGCLLKNTSIMALADTVRAISGQHPPYVDATSH